VKGLWNAVSSRLGLGSKQTGGLRWVRIDDAKQTDFFRWFSFAETGTARDADGNAVVSFRPSGEKFHRLVKLDAVLDGQGCIDSLRLSLAKSFLDDNQDGLFARDITKSFLRSALPPPDDRTVASLADEIEWRHDFPVITPASNVAPPLPTRPSTAFLAFTGGQQNYEEAYSRCRMQIEQAKTDGSQAVEITVRAC
jgi:hypothetical protein